MAEYEFNRQTAERFALEYEKITGIQLSFKRIGTPFPDAVLETEDKQEIGVEFVSVVFPFISQEEHHFDKYRKQMYVTLAPDRPRYKQVQMRLQLSMTVMESRPARLPGLASPDGKQLLKEFVDLISKHFDEISTIWGGVAGGALLNTLQRENGDLEYPTLTHYFDAIMFHRIGLGDPSRPHPEDPVIASPNVIYSMGEVADAVIRAFEAKLDKGESYRTHILLLHTLPTEGKPYHPAIRMHSEDFAKLGQRLVKQYENLSRRFSEIWLLTEDFLKPLHRP